jgi:hypothetical protein
VSVSKLIEFVQSYRKANPTAAKDRVANATAEAMKLEKHRSIFANDEIAVRFSTASGTSFSNVVASLSALQPFDTRPFIIVLIRPDKTEFFLANTSFLKKISHSSHELRVDNVRGSFLGHDILREYEGIPNRPENFEKLFALHSEFTWEENLARLAAATGNIVGTGKRFEPTPAQLNAILAAPGLAAVTIQSDAYKSLRHELAEIVAEKAKQILSLARVDNVNVRGNSIEQLITGGINEHRLGDMVRSIGGVELELEIKTKLMDRASSPKAYNIDKALETLSTGKSLIAFCFVGINVAAETVSASVVSILDRVVIDATRVQFHWAGRNSRGVTQLTGNLMPLFSPAYNEVVDIDQAKVFLQGLIDLKAT